MIRLPSTLKYLLIALLAGCGNMSVTDDQTPTDMSVSPTGGEDMAKPPPDPFTYEARLKKCEDELARTGDKACAGILLLLDGKLKNVAPWKGTEGVHVNVGSGNGLEGACKKDLQIDAGKTGSLPYAFSITYPTTLWGEDFCWAASNVIQFAVRVNLEDGGSASGALSVTTGTKPTGPFIIEIELKRDK